MAYRMHAGVCACCSRYREKHTVKFYSYTEVPNLHLLSVNGPRSADMPRHALTTQSGLCLQPAACRIDGADLIIALCDDCYKHLDKAQIPLTSLVYVDTGGIPKSPVPELKEIAKWAVHMHKVRPCTALQPRACHAIGAHYTPARPSFTTLSHPTCTSPHPLDAAHFTFHVTSSFAPHTGR